MANRSGEFNVAHSLTSDFTSSNFDTTSFANDAFILNLFIATARTLPILDRTEDALAKKTVTLRLERAVVDGLGLFNFAVRPAHDVVAGRDPDSDLVEQADVCHIALSYLLKLEGQSQAVPRLKTMEKMPI
jgi:hypothetical protein